MRQITVGIQNLDMSRFQMFDIWLGVEKFGFRISYQNLIVKKSEFQMFPEVNF